MVKIIQVDFGNRDLEGHVSLHLPCSQRDLARLQPLHVGEEVFLTDGEGFVRAVLQEDHVARPLWDTWTENLPRDLPLQSGKVVREWKS